ncbi:MAG: OmpH family outer membrane protein [Bacteroidota bacterium]
MKKLMKVALVALCMVFIGNFANAQTKIGYINTNELIPQLPDYKTVNTAIESFKKQFVDVLQGMDKELQEKAAGYQSKQATMTDAAKLAAQGELADIQKRAQTYQTEASQKVEAKGAELMKPLIDKVNAAITAVAKEKGYTYVIDSSTTALLVAPPTDDLLAAVKLKLGVK